MEGHTGNKLKIDRSKAHDTSDPLPHLEVTKSKVKSPDCLMPGPKISHIFKMGRPTNFKLGIRMDRWSMMICIADRHDLKGEGYNVKSSVWHVFAHNSTKKVQIFAPAATTKIKMINIYENHVLLHCNISRIKSVSYIVEFLVSLQVAQNSIVLQMFPNYHYSLPVITGIFSYLDLPDY